MIKNLTLVILISIESFNILIHLLTVFGIYQIIPIEKIAILTYFGSEILINWLVFKITKKNITNILIHTLSHMLSVLNLLGIYKEEMIDNVWTF